MCADKLKVIATSADSAQNNERLSSFRKLRREAEAVFERMWLTAPEQFDPLRNCMEALRVERTLKLIREHLKPEGKKAVDLGCGTGWLTRKLHEKGAHVDAVDIATIPLKALEKTEGIHPIQDYVPHTHLKDDAYDIVLSTELIGYLPQEEYRIYFSELCRLAKPEGYVVCSSLIDIYSDEAIDRFAALAESEFSIEKWALSYHYLWTRFVDFFQAPERFVKASKDPLLRSKELRKRRSMSQAWFRFNSSPIPSLFWWGVQWLAYPFVHLLKKNKRLLLILESISHFIWQEQGISHAIFLAKRRPLFHPLPPEQQPIERLTKKIKWE